MEYKGEDRRKNFSMAQNERDMLIEMHSDLKHLVEWAKSHDQSDNTRFDSANKRISWIEKVAYLGIGGLATLQIVLKILRG